MNIEIFRVNLFSKDINKEWFVLLFYTKTKYKIRQFLFIFLFF